MRNWVIETGTRLTKKEIRALRLAIIKEGENKCQARFPENQVAAHNKTLRDMAIIDLMIEEGVNIIAIPKIRMGGFIRVEGNWHLRVNTKDNCERMLLVSQRSLKSIIKWTTVANLHFGNDYLLLGRGNNFLFYFFQHGGNGKILNKPMNTNSIHYIVAEYGWIAGISPAKGKARLSPGDLCRFKPAVVIIDDHDVVRWGIRSVLEQNGGFEIVGEADTSLSGLELVRVHKPDIAIVDISMPGDLDGLDLINNLSNLENKNTQVVVLTMHEKEVYARRAFLNGAKGYILKDDVARELVPTIEKVLNGERHLSEKLNMGSIELLLRGTKNERSDEETFELLTDREKQVFKFVIKGMTSKDIAKHLTISPKTVNNYRRKIKEKLELDFVAEWTQLAFRIGIIGNDFAPVTLVDVRNDARKQ